MTTPGTPNRHRQLERATAALGTLPFVVGLLVALNGLYIALVAFGNITDPAANQAFVQHVLAMDTTNFGAPPGTGLDPHVMWRAITDPWLQNAAYVGVIVWETLTALVLGAAVVRGYGSAARRTGPPARCRRSGSSCSSACSSAVSSWSVASGSRCGAPPPGTGSTPPSATP
jgi:predicted small integral membrane protein